MVRNNTYPFMPGGMRTSSVLAVVGLVIIAGGIGYYLWRDQRAPQEMSVRCGSMQVTLPAEFSALRRPPNNSTSVKLDSQGCSTETNGCTCLKMDGGTGTGVAFGTMETEDRKYAIPESLQDQTDYLRQFVVETQQSADKGEVVSEETGIYQGYPSVTLTVDSSKNNTRQRSIVFIRNMAIYSINFGARKEIFERQWPSMKRAIDDIDFVF